MAELSQVHRISILGMNPNCLHAGPGGGTQVAAVLGEAANHSLAFGLALNQGPTFINAYCQSPRILID